MLGQPSAEEQAVIADTWQRSRSTMTGRERFAELLVSSAFVAATAALLAFRPPHAFTIAPAAICFVVLILSMRIRIDTPFGATLPTQLAFVPLLFAMPVALVPIVVVVAMVVARVPEVVTGQVRPSRLLQAVSSSWFAIGPVAVFELAAISPDAASPLLLIAALAAQFATDFALSALRFGIGRGATLSAQLPETWVYVVDAALSGVALLVAEEIHRAPIAALAPLPLLGLVALFARERRQRLDSLLELNDAYRHARDEAVEASKMKSAFLRNVSHEIRTPMNGVLGMNELLLDTELDADQRTLAEQVASSGRHMLTIINDILDISKIETGHLELDIGEFDLRHAIDGACAPARPDALAKQLALTIEVDDDVPQRVRGDGTRVRQAVANLVSNAVKFTHEGFVRVRVSAIADGDSQRIRVEVNDSGIGIAPESLERMFDPFTQADGSTTRKYGGNGLGLAITKQLLDLMGGTIGAQSVEGTGSKFWFELTMPAVASAVTRREPVHQLSGRRTNHTGALVLVVEDSPVNRLVAVRVLERAGYRVHVVNDGREALQALAAQSYDAVLMDCQMPDIDGYDATKELRRREGDGPRTPVIAMTAHAMTGDRERCLAAGMDDYIAKPVRAQTLIETLERWISADHATERRTQSVAAAS